MEGQTTDRRVRRTKRQLLTALTKLLTEKSLRDITVRELADICDINRGTFYVHYADVYDMVDQVEDELLGEFSKQVSSHSREELRARPELVIQDVFTFVAKYSELCLALLSRNGDIVFLERLKDILRENCRRFWQDILGVKLSADFDYELSFILGGCSGTLLTWMLGGMKESPQKMAEIIRAMISDGFKSLS